LTLKILSNMLEKEQGLSEACHFREVNIFWLSGSAAFCERLSLSNYEIGMF
jgi:hypothetical protein